MPFSTHLISLVCGLSLFTACSAAPSGAVPSIFPLPNGFPNIVNPSPELTGIEQQAHGSLPDGAPPAKISADTITSLKLIAFNELSEVAFFTELICNITNNVVGYEIEPSSERKYILASLVAIQAQEELHQLDANEALMHFTNSNIQPCQYNFPVNNITEAITLAWTFTDVVLGALQDVSERLGISGDTGLIQGVTSVIGQEGEQNGMFRVLSHKLPSQLPFKTICPREFAHSALVQTFIVPGSCPNADSIGLATYQPLFLETQKVLPQSQDLTFGLVGPISNPPNVFIAYINQQNTPIVEKITVTGNKDGLTSFTASFPYDAATFGNGLTIAAVTNSIGPFDTAADVAAATLYGPALIELDYGS